MKIILVF